ncbi:MAG TPA: helix-turn-helix domain-containing protein, partial [Telluria sp.]
RPPHDRHHAAQAMGHRRIDVMQLLRVIALLPGSGIVTVEESRVEFGVLSFASNAPASEKFGSAIAHFLPDLALIRDYAFASSQRFVSARCGAEPMPHLTKRELEVINWVMVGKSSWEISKITSCSEATINFHMSNIRQKFHVNTRQQALVKAIALGIIKPEDQHR